MTKRKGWPKGLPLKGYKESGLSFEQWRQKHADKRREELRLNPFNSDGFVSEEALEAFPPTPVICPKKVLTNSNAPEYFCKKDGWGRVYIHVNGKKCAQVNLRESPFKQAARLGEAYENPDDTHHTDPDVDSDALHGPGY